MTAQNRIVVNWLLCDGNAACVSEAPTHFDINDDDELIVTDEHVEPADLDDVRRAVAACPKRALALEV